MKNSFVFYIFIFFSLSFDRLNVFKYCIFSSVIHEIGHIAAYYFSVGKLPKIRVSLFGFRMENNVTYYKNYIFILALGPAINFLLLIISSILLKYNFSLNLYVFMLVNLIIFTVNILPIYYLDGGQILYAVSPCYNRYYIKISIITVLICCVMLISFTHVYIPFIIFVIYFVINMVNDI